MEFAKSKWKMYQNVLAMTAGSALAAKFWTVLGHLIAACMELVTMSMESQPVSALKDGLELLVKKVCHAKHNSRFSDSLNNQT